jgi:hypothetical protein
VSGRTLRGWKEIAGHLRVSERTAMRWAHELDLPVRRTAGRRGFGVHADPAALDAWQADAGTRPGRLASEERETEAVPAQDLPPRLKPARPGRRKAAMVATAVTALALPGLGDRTRVAPKPPGGSAPAVVLTVSLGDTSMRMKQALGSPATLRLSAELGLSLTPLAITREPGEADRRLTLLATPFAASEGDGALSGARRPSSVEPLHLMRGVTRDVLVAGHTLRVRWDAPAPMPGR